MAQSYSKTIICLANSRKNSGRCVAGKEIGSGSDGTWVRPVGNTSTGELSEYDRRYKNGEDPSILDVISIAMKGASPHEYQVENHLIDADYYWQFVRKASAAEVRAAVDTVKGPLWSNDSSSTYGLNDRVAESVASSHGYSLLLVDVTDLVLNVRIEGAAFGNGKRCVRGDFSLSGHSYRLKVTDPVVEARYMAQGDGTYGIGQCLLCISLGEPYQGYAYKLIAGVVV